MRDPNRIDRMIERLRVLWHTNPELRLGQIVGNLVPSQKAPYYFEDDAMEAEMIRVTEGGWGAPRRGQP